MWLPPKTGWNLEPRSPLELSRKARKLRWSLKLQRGREIMLRLVPTNGNMMVVKGDHHSGCVKPKMQKSSEHAYKVWVCVLMA
jgi:hypothetical protein